MTSRSRLVFRAGRLAAALAVVSLTVVVSVAPSNPAGAQTTPASTSQLRLTDQTSWVADGGIFQVGLAVTTPNPAGARLQMSVYQALSSRSDFNETLADRIHTRQLKVFDLASLSSLGASPQLALTVNPKGASRPPQ